MISARNMETRQGLSKPTTVLLTAASAVVVIAGLREASEILSPLLMAGFLAIISTIKILVHCFHKLRISLKRTGL